MALKGTRGDTSIPWKKKGLKDMDVNEPEAGESAASLRLGLRTALFSLEWTVSQGWLQREEREVPRGKVISLSFYKGEWLIWAAN